MFERALASICLFHKVLRRCVARGPCSLRLHTCANIYIYIRGDIALRSPLIAKIEFRTGEESVDGMKDCGSSRKLMIGSFHKIFRCNEISSNQLSPIYLSPFPSPFLPLFTSFKNQTIEIRNLYSCKKKVWKRFDRDFSLAHEFESIVSSRATR